MFDDATCRESRPESPEKPPLWNIQSLPGAVLAHSAQSKRNPSINTLKRDPTGRLKFRKPLAQLLYDVSRLMETMENYRDTMMFEKYLHRPAPLHPRRTLDQAYYCSLKNTRTRDRDQVVYRETTAKVDGFHRWEYTDQDEVRWTCWDLHEKDGNARKPIHSQAEDQNLQSRNNTKLKKRCRDCGSARRHKRRWLGKEACPGKHEATTDEEQVPKKKPERRCQVCRSAAFGCGYQCKLPDGGGEAPLGNTDPVKKIMCFRCRDNIRKLSRLIMVDQLWMWILDGHTILTFFPRRYGFNRHDLSGIHRSIRSRFETMRDGQIRTIYDLALIILTECTKTFFDRTSTLDRQPRVLDLFSEAIGRVVRMSPRARNA